MKDLHVLIVDDHEIVRFGLKALIKEHFPEYTVEEADTYETMTEVLQQKKCTHMILDLQLRDTGLPERFPQIRKEYPELYILVHTMLNRAEYSGWMQGMGANAFLSKESGREEMIGVLTFFLRYNMNADARRHQERVANGRWERPDNPFQRLSHREQELTRLILQGDTYKEIQNVLRLKSSTVSTMKNRIFRKLKVSNLVGLVKLADNCHFR
jgi:DNA-binding NarL/FixJ family response regulator